MSKPPPPRYKIVERGGRLHTIDTWAEQPPAAPLQRRADPIAPGDALGAPLVAALFRVRDADGRRLLTTSPNWDRKGPRVIALLPPGERRIAALGLLSIGVTLVLLLVALIDLDMLMPICVVAVVLAGAVSSSRTSMVTSWLDSLGQETPR
ncbi:hypothetical protein [Sphingomonas sp. PAMC 26605]|uniref:hypothetical protein n=1 Tax=Sphingomonas sp. PAMC 26605 TaxID=1112214 RepID=UPI0012F50379|nr:hypothetical protein [Sphingomonas sp. PAMC 26605]